MARPTWDRHFLNLARAWASMGTCPRLRVGCVLVLEEDELGRPERIVLASGYNGAVQEEAHCDDVGCQLVGGDCENPEHGKHCEAAEHAERNAINSAARHGRAVKGSTCYTTAYPCWPCARALVRVGVRRIVYAEAYRVDPRVSELTRRHGISVEHLPWTGTPTT